MINTRHLRRGYGHDGRRDMAVASAGNITAGSGHRDLLLSGDQARDDLNLAVLNGRLLRFGKLAHVVMGKTDVVLQFLRHLISRCL